MKTFSIGKKKIGDGQLTYIVGEMAWSHDGSIENAKIIIKAIADAGCDAVNFHVTCLENYMVPHYRLKDKISAYDNLAKLTLNFDDWEILFENARELGLKISALCNDLESVEFVKKQKADIIMFHASGLTEEELIRRIGQIGKPVFFAVGGSTVDEILQAIRWLNEEGCDEIALLYGMQNYPTKLEDNNANYLKTLKDIFERPVGFSDHTEGEDPLALIVPLMGIPLGANIIEKHVTYDRSAKGIDYIAALNPDELVIFVDHIRRIETIFGSSKVMDLTEAQRSYRQTVRKRAVAITDIKAGQVIKAEDIRYLRSDEGIQPENIKFYLGRKIKKDVKKYDPITAELF